MVLIQPLYVCCVHEHRLRKSILTYVVDHFFLEEWANSKEEELSLDLAGKSKIDPNKLWDVMGDSLAIWKQDIMWLGTCRSRRWLSSSCLGYEMLHRHPCIRRLSFLVSKYVHRSALLHIVPITLSRSLGMTISADISLLLTTGI